LPANDEPVPATVGEAIAAGWVAIRAECPGHQISQIPWTMIAGGEARTLASIAARLRCHRCRRPPAAVYLHRLVADNDRGPPSERQLPLDHLLAEGGRKSG
jgi:hypothetical protein